MRDLVSNVAARQSIAPAAYTATETGASVDRRGHESVTFAITVGAWTDGTHVFSAEHSDDDSTWSAVTSDDLIDTFPTVEDDESPSGTSSSDSTDHLVGYTGAGKRYVRIKSTVTGSPGTGAVYGASVLLGHAHVAPTS